ncbi:hypothetical protein SAMN06295960_1525 [Paenibacillus aquistagni]|uniref:Uncharacterized protein n=1 Tax=Paenibacillus aquistagni TaxID=1852522 RepID=A0A1X7JF66_9BACL|nr:hypothetical protein SAMN06295960_1525 [Paenibacillus aquistagni]
MEAILDVTYVLVGALIIVYDCFLPNTAVYSITRLLDPMHDAE